MHCMCMCVRMGSASGACKAATVTCVAHCCCSVQWLAEQSRNWIAPDQLDERIEWALSHPQACTNALAHLIMPRCIYMLQLIHVLGHPCGC